MKISYDATLYTYLAFQSNISLLDTSSFLFSFRTIYVMIVMLRQL